MSLSLLTSTLKYALEVKGFASVPTTSFPFRMGSVNSDMFRIRLSSKEIDNAGALSLADYHFAFLTSPLFSLELWLLSQTGAATDPTTTTHLHHVATGKVNGFGPWRAVAEEGNRLTNMLDPATNDTHMPSCTVVMRSEFNGTPFCDTWWAMEQVDEKSDERAVDLVFGTALKGQAASSRVVQALTPMHNWYSRLLLAAAKAQLIQTLRARSSTKG